MHDILPQFPWINERLWKTERPASGMRLQLFRALTASINCRLERLSQNKAWFYSVFPFLLMTFTILCFVQCGCLSGPLWWSLPPSSFGTLNWIWAPNKTDVMQKLLPLGKTETWMYHNENKSGKTTEWKERTHLNFLWAKGITKEDIIFFRLKRKEAAKNPKSSHSLQEWMNAIILN